MIEIKNLTELQERLEYFAHRSKYLVGTALEKDAEGKTIKVALNSKVTKYFEDLLLSTKDPEKIRQRTELMERAVNDPAVRQQLNAIRIEQFNNYIFASQNFLDFFFEMVNLKPDERPNFQNTTLNEVSVYYVGQDGSPKKYKVPRDDQFELKNLHYLTTDAVRYQVVDIYRGSIVDNAVQTLRLAYDMRNQMEQKSFDLFNTGTTVFGTFTFTGNRNNYPYLANSRIKVANLPPTNELRADGTTVNTNFRFGVMDKIVDYYTRWFGSDPDGDVKPTGRILVPGSDVSGIGKDMTPTNAKQNEIAEQVQRQGWIDLGMYLGINWRIVPDNTLQPGVCYPESTRKPGRIWLKPALDQEKIINTAELDEKNEEERKMRKVFGADINSVTRRYLCRVTYRD